MIDGNERESRVAGLVMDRTGFPFFRVPCHDDWDLVFVFGGAMMKVKRELWEETKRFIDAIRDDSAEGFRWLFKDENRQRTIEFGMRVVIDGSWRDSWWRALIVLRSQTLLCGVTEQSVILAFEGGLGALAPIEFVSLLCDPVALDRLAQKVDRPERRHPSWKTVIDQVLKEICEGRHLAGFGYYRPLSK